MIGEADDFQEEIVGNRGSSSQSSRATMPETDAAGMGKVLDSELDEAKKSTVTQAMKFKRGDLVMYESKTNGRPIEAEVSNVGDGFYTIVSRGTTKVLKDRAIINRSDKVQPEIPHCKGVPTPEWIQGAYKNDQQAADAALLRHAQVSGSTCHCDFQTGNSCRGSLRIRGGVSNELRSDHSSGFGALFFVHVVNGILFAEHHCLRPFVEFDPQHSSAYYEEARGN